MKITYDLTGQSNITANSAVQGAAYSINCYTEFNTDKNAYLISTPGLRHETDYAANGSCCGLYTTSFGPYAEPVMFVAYTSGDVCYYNAGNLVKLLSISANSHPVFAETGGQRPHLLIADGYTLYAINLKDLTQTVITLPKRITSDDEYVQPSYVAVVDQTVICNDIGSDLLYFTIRDPFATETRQVFDIADGKVVYESDGITVKEHTVSSADYMFLDDYSTQMYFTASSSSDITLAISSVDDKLAVFGQSSIEFRQKQINQLDTQTDVSWQIVTHTEQKSFGIYSAHSLARIDKQQFLLGTGDSTNICVLTVIGADVKSISLPWIDRILTESATEDTEAWTYASNGHSFYIISLKDYSLVYDISTQQWHIRLSRNYDLSKTAYMAKYCTFYNSKLYVGSAVNTSIMTLDDTYYYEDIDADTHIPLLRIRQSPVFNVNYAPFVISNLSVEMNTRICT
nr:MAG TPA: stabilization protein [Caudoviricetes sp.]